MHRNLILKPASWQVLQAEVTLPDGSGTGYGIRFFLEAKGGRRIIEHSGGLSGFTTLNQLYLESGTRARVSAIEKMLFAPGQAAAVPHKEAAEALLKVVVAQLQIGKLDRSLLTSNLPSFSRRRSSAITAKA